jgi:hypothetical protein
MPRVLLVLPLLAALLAPRPSFAQPVDWLAEQLTAPGYGPDLAGDPAVGNVHLTFVQEDYARHLVISSGGSVGMDETQDEWFGETDPAGFGPAIAFGPDDHVHLVWKSDAGGGLWNLWYARRATGQWSAPLLLAQGVLWCWAPQVTSDGAGATVVATAGLDDWPDAEVRAWRIVDAALQQEVTGVLPARSDDRVDVVAGPALDERHLFSGVPDEAGAVHHARSIDGGATWTDLGAIQSPTCSGGRAGQPDAAVGPDGQIHLVYGCSDDSDRGGQPSVRHLRIQGSAVVADVPVTAAGDLDDWSLGHGVARTAVTAFGSVGVLWLARPGTSLWATSSDDDGATWHPAEQVALVAGAAEGRDAPALASTGRVFFAVWPDGVNIHFRRGLGPVLIGDDDDSADDDDATPDDDDSAPDDDDSAASDDDDSTTLQPPPPGGCCDGGGDGGGASAALLLALLLPSLRRRRSG